MAIRFLFILLTIWDSNNNLLGSHGEGKTFSDDESYQVLCVKNQQASKNSSSPSKTALRMNGCIKVKNATTDTMVATTSCKDNWFIKSALTSVDVQILFDETVLCSKNLTDLSTYPTTNFIFSTVFHNTLECIADLMVYWKRCEGAFIYDKFTGVNDNLAFRYLAKRSIRARMINLKYVADIRNTTLHLIRSNANIIIMCNTRITNSIISKIKNYGVFQGNTTWILVSDHVPQQLDGVNIPPNSQVTLISPKRHKVTVKFDELQLQANNSEAWRNSSWTAPSLKLQLKDEEKVSLYFKTAKVIDILDVFYSLQTARTETVRFAHWNEVNRLSMLEILDDADKQQRLKGRRIRLTVFQHAPYSFLTRKNGTLTVTGYFKEMVLMLVETLNIQYSLREIDEIFGVNLNGTFTGYVGVLYRREADMGMNVLAMTNARAQGVRYAGPVTKAYLAIVYNRPTPVIPPTTYLLPFSLSVWIYSFAGLLLVVVSIWIVVLISPTSMILITKSERVHTSFFRTITFTFLEEVLEYPVGIPSKIMYGTLLIMTLVMFSHYTSIFTSFLAYQEEKMPFRNLEDVVGQKEYTILIINNTRHQDILQTAKSGTYAKVWKRIQQQGDISFEYSFYSGLMKTYTGNYVHLSDGPTCTYLSAGNCSIAFAPGKYLEEFYNMAHRRDFPYTRLFTKGLIKIMEGGVFRRLTVAYSLETKKSCNQMSSSSSFGINQVTGVFVVYGCGILLALLVLIIERVLPKHLVYQAIQNRRDCGRVRYPVLVTNSVRKEG